MTGKVWEFCYKRPVGNLEMSCKAMESHLQGCVCITACTAIISAWHWLTTVLTEYILACSPVY